MTLIVDDVTATAHRVLSRARVFAVVGASPSSWRPSQGVMRILLDDGYEVVPIMPHAQPIFGRLT